ncbi:hypothetical protein [Flavobacterium hydatis]|uniref:Uncharacterized protein n=1 Tax=Flavobacterium hydatis TaxID=991 RepID=A0ABX4CN32_FLAHY|nr:hypothetical protein [Flavobacterium hydatis]OXA97904.1 hypothetical protein B0A62_03335 [Flavobacterium hydatis]
MWYKVNFNVLAIQLLPTFLRKPAFMAFVQILMKPITAIYDDWIIARNENIFRLYHTGQVCHLRKSLNFKFDEDQNRIEIKKGNLYNTTYIYTEGEGFEKFANQEAEPETIWLRTEVETADTGLDFIVSVPEQIYKTRLESIEAHVKFYKAGGIRSKVISK